MRGVDLLRPASAYGNTLLHAADAEAARVALAAFSPFHAGKWVNPLAGAAPLAGANIGTANTRLFPFVIDRACTISDLGCRVTTLGAGNARLGIYASDATNGNPTGDPIAQCTVSTGAASEVSAAISGGDKVLLPGLLWGAAQVDNATAVLQVVNGSPAGRLVGAATLAAVTSSATGVLTGKTTATGYASGLPTLSGLALTDLSTTSWGVVFYKVTSVP